MPKLARSKEPRIKKSISFRPDQIEAIDEQADREGHGNVSLIVQRAVDRELSLQAHTISAEVVTSAEEVRAA